MTEVLIKVGFLAIAALNGAIIFTIMDVKGASWMQRRPGPLHVGLRGFIFPLAEILKFVQKEDIIPTEVDRPVFKWAPAYVMVSCVALFAVVPLSPTLVVADLELGVFFALAISSLGTIGVLTAGWSSANKYSLMGGLRAAGQLIAYELPLILAVVGVVIQAETMSLVGIVEKQIEWGVPFVIGGQIIGFLIFMVAATAEMMRVPFDMPIGESELTMGFMTEYSGIRFLIFYISEYMNIVYFMRNCFHIISWWLPRTTPANRMGKLLWTSCSFNKNSYFRFYLGCNKMVPTKISRRPTTKSCMEDTYTRIFS